MYLYEHPLGLHFPGKARHDVVLRGFPVAQGRARFDCDYQGR